MKMLYMLYMSIKLRSLMSDAVSGSQPGRRATPVPPLVQSLGARVVALEVIGIRHHSVPDTSKGLFTLRDFKLVTV